MASKTLKLEKVRKRKQARMGAKRKASLNNHGTTPSAKELFGDK